MRPTCTRGHIRPATCAALAAVSAAAGIAGHPAPAGATLPGANGVIAYHDDEPVSPTIGSVTPDGAVQRALGAASGGPSWAPSGLRLAFPFQTETSQIALFTAAADGSDRVRLADLPGTPYAPAWSPDGTNIAFALYTQAAANYDIYVADADGSDAVQLTSHPSDDLSPTWSPDGGKIAFHAQRDGDSEIYVMDADGDPEVNVSNRPASHEADPDWAPDGSKLLFRSFAGIGVMNPDGSGAQILAESGYSPVWSPDGERIAFARSPGPGDRAQVYVMDADGSGATQLTQGGGDKLFVDWQPLSQAIRSQTSVTAPAQTVRYGTDVPLTAEVTSSGMMPTGPVQFRINGRNDGAPVPLDAAGRSRFEPEFLLDAGDVVSATYAGDARWGWSAGTAALQVLPALTTTALRTSPNPVTTGGTVDVEVEVANRSTDIAPFGSVQFYVDGEPLTDPLGLDEDGTVLVRLIANVPPGDYAIDVDYVDDTAAIPDFEPSGASLVQRVVAPAAPPGKPAVPSTPASPVAVVRRADLAGFASTFAAALKRRGFTALQGPGPRFSAAAPGTFSVRVEAAAPGGSAAAAKRVLVAAGRRAFTAPGAGRVRIAVTRQGKRLLRRAKRLKLTVSTRFTPRQGAAVSHVARVRVTKRGSAKAKAGVRSARRSEAVVLRMHP